jgi:hypothetical protein
VIRLGNLVILQAIFALASVAYLLVSGWREHTIGAPLSAAPILPSILLFVVYSACLVLPRLGNIGWYRATMVLAILFFGGGGVAGNILRYVESGIAEYASFSAWFVAVGINAFGTALNVIAALGLFQHFENQKNAK